MLNKKTVKAGIEERENSKQEKLEERFLYERMKIN